MKEFNESIHDDNTTEYTNPVDEDNVERIYCQAVRCTNGEVVDDASTCEASIYANQRYMDTIELARKGHVPSLVSLRILKPYEVYDKYVSQESLIYHFNVCMCNSFCNDPLTSEFRQISNYFHYGIVVEKDERMAEIANRISVEYDFDGDEDVTPWLSGDEEEQQYFLNWVTTHVTDDRCGDCCTSIIACLYIDFDDSPLDRDLLWNLLNEGMRHGYNDFLEEEKIIFETDDPEVAALVKRVTDERMTMPEILALYKSYPGINMKIKRAVSCFYLNGWGVEKDPDLARMIFNYKDNMELLCGNRDQVAEFYLDGELLPGYTDRFPEHFDEMYPFGKKLLEKCEDNEIYTWDNVRNDEDLVPF